MQKRISYIKYYSIEIIARSINVIQRNKNYGWNVVEGCTNNYLYANPIYTYTSEDAPHAITQGPYYDGHGSGFKAIRERVLFADLYSGTLYAIQADNVGVSCGITPSVVASAPALISSILVVGNEVIVSNVIMGFLLSIDLLKFLFKLYIFIRLFVYINFLPSIIPVNIFYYEYFLLIINKQIFYLQNLLIYFKIHRMANFVFLFEN